MNTIKPFLPWTLRIFLSVLFLFSAYAKLYPSAFFAITTFEMKQLVPLGFSECWAPYFSRFIIGCEIALGIGFLQPHYLRKLIIPLSALLLLVFNMHLAYSIATNTGGNCGCFGDLLPMTPTQAFIKNLLTIGLLFWLWKMISSKDQKVSHNFFIALSIALASILFMFVYVPISPCKVLSNGDIKTQTSANPVIIIDEDTSTTLSPSDTNPKIENPKNLNPKEKPTALETIYEPTKVKSGFEKYAPNIDEGKKLLLFFAPGCDHCQAAAKKLVEMSKNDKDFPKMFIIFMDEEPEKIPDFFEKAGKKISYTTLDVGSFWGVIGSQRDTPGVLYLWNGNQVVFFDGIKENEFDEVKLKKALKKEKL